MDVDGERYQLRYPSSELFTMEGIEQLSAAESELFDSSTHQAKTTHHEEEDDDGDDDECEDLLYAGPSTSHEGTPVSLPDVTEVGSVFGYSYIFSCS